MKVRHIKRRTDKHYYGMWTFRWPIKPMPIVPMTDPVAKHVLLMTSGLANAYRASVYPTQADIDLQTAKDAILGVTPADRARDAKSAAAFAAPYGRTFDPQAQLDGEAEDRYIAMLDHRHERGGGR